jgi:hypothetical protein
MLPFEEISASKLTPLSGPLNGPQPSSKSKSNRCAKHKALKIKGLKIDRFFAVPVFTQLIHRKKIAIIGIFQDI